MNSKLLLRSTTWNRKQIVSSLSSITLSNNKLNYYNLNKIKSLLIKKIKLSSLNNYNQQQRIMSSLTNLIEKPKVVFVLGGPGAGKGTQCQKIVDNFDFVHLSAGDLLREERSRKDSEYSELIESYIRDGKIVPVEITCSLIEKEMIKNVNEFGRNKFLIDGFPRNQDNLDGWTRTMAEKVNLLFVLFFDCSEDICVQRCLHRGQSGSGRSDDNLDSLKKRIQTYKNDSLPIINHYKEQDLVCYIDASKNVDDVFEKVKDIFKSRASLKSSGDF